MEHLGVEYRWSKYSPTKKTEILEAERSKDEVRDILSRLVGSEIRYARLGYWMRRPPYGYTAQKMDTEHGKRSILVPHPQEAVFARKMFELRASGQYSDAEIADKINAAGYRGRIQKSQTRGALITGRKLWKIVRKPIYAGINDEKWTNGRPVKCAFKGLVSIELFNKANKGKKIVTEYDDGKITVRDIKEIRHSTDKGARSVDFPFKRFVMCPKCRKPLLGSYSRGKNGKRYPAYHCHRRGHYFRVRKEDLEKRVDNFIDRLQLSPQCVDYLITNLGSNLQQTQTQYESRQANLDNRIASLQNEISSIVQKLKILNNESAIRHMETELERLEKTINSLKEQKQALIAQKPQDIKSIRTKLKHIVKHLNQALKQQMDPVKKARLFGLLFERPPTYEDLECQTPDSQIFTDVNALFQPKNYQKMMLVTPRGIEPLFPG